MLFYKAYSVDQDKLPVLVQCLALLLSFSFASILVLIPDLAASVLPIIGLGVIEGSKRSYLLSLPLLMSALDLVQLQYRIALHTPLIEVTLYRPDFQGVIIYMSRLAAQHTRTVEHNHHPAL